MKTTQMTWLHGHAWFSASKLEKICLAWIHRKTMSNHATVQRIIEVCESTQPEELPAGRERFFSISRRYLLCGKNFSAKKRMVGQLVTVTGTHRRDFRRQA
jgi:hypothetical protein